MTFLIYCVINPCQCLTLSSVDMGDVISPLGWPWEAQSSPRVARESWGWRSSTRLPRPWDFPLEWVAISFSNACAPAPPQLVPSRHACPAGDQPAQPHWSSCPSLAPGPPPPLPRCPLPDVITSSACPQVHTPALSLLPTNTSSSPPATAVNTYGSLRVPGPVLGSPGSARSQGPALERP